ncbi:MAG: hypothetical protein AUH96_10000 [Nitrospirae bacterium 13_2_20CM_2_61_4]|nr:MAG: hypothetical protein AUH96_10000 [Nitrospirae bacterium 13_2_20CM_2_61_4]
MPKIIRLMVLRPACESSLKILPVIIRQQGARTSRKRVCSVRYSKSMRLVSQLLLPRFLSRRATIIIDWTREALG